MTAPVPGHEHPVAVADYGLLGDTRTAALSSPGGSLDWLCLPRFDSDPVFANLVGGEAAGRFVIEPMDAHEPPVRRYRPGSPVLETTWRTPGATVTLTEGMVAESRHALLPTTLLVRRVECRGDAASVAVLFDPRRGERHREPRSERRAGALVCTWGAPAVGLVTEPDLALEPRRPMEVRVTQDRPLTFALAVADREPLVHVNGRTAWQALERDEAGWRQWSAGFDDTGPFAETVARSLLTLRLLTYSPSGAPVAAPTTSLPESPGHARNWDYRYAWPRDASLGVGAFLEAGKDEEARAFLAWLLHASRLERPRLPPMLSLHGKPVPDERELDGWPGYAGSRPVRVGNGAGRQHQLDTYGWVLDAGWQLTQAGHGLYGETWRALAGFADHVVDRWREPDAGIWERRDAPAHHVHSKLMGWAALDRALRIAETRGTREKRRRRWRQERSAIAADVLGRGYDNRRATFVGSYDTPQLDAALLAPPLPEIAAELGPGLTGTIDAVQRELSPQTPFVYRYPPGSDGLDGTEGAFLPCSFWTVEALARTGRLGEALDWFERLVSAGNSLGLYAEEIDPTSGTQLGNYPQALTHSALVQAALAIRDATRAARRLTATNEG
jgi:GH15 family glucan-1,4-alpha-glucosidase